jgi:hypothetical protein
MIDVPGEVYGSFAEGINAVGDVGCYWYDAIDIDISHGALLHDGKYYKGDYPNSIQTFSFGINDEGNIVGYYFALRHSNYSLGYKATYK